VALRKKLLSIVVGARAGKNVCHPGQDKTKREFAFRLFQTTEGAEAQPPVPETYDLIFGYVVVLFLTDLMMTHPMYSMLCTIIAVSLLRRTAAYG
jgi:hypothetical protein